MYESIHIESVRVFDDLHYTDTSKSIPSLTGLNVTVCPSIFSAATGNLTVGGLFFATRIRIALGSSKAIISSKSQI